MCLIVLQGGTTVDREEIKKISLKAIEKIKSELPEDERTFDAIEFVLEEAKRVLKGLKVKL